MEPFEIFEALLTPAGKADPYPYYALLHEHGHSAELAPGATLVFGYDAIDATLREAALRVADAEYYDEFFPSWRDHPSLAMESVQSLNPPRHGQIRGPLSKAFTHRRVADLRPAAEAFTDRLLDEMADHGEGGAPVDFVRFAYQLPVNVISELIGIPPSDRVEFSRMATNLASALEPESDFEVRTDADRAAVELRDYLSGLAEQCRIDPRDSLLSALVSLTDSDDARLTENALLDNVMLLLVAGFATTTGMLGHGMDLLLRDPGLADALRSGAMGVDAFVEEVLRYDPPVQMVVRRRVYGDRPAEEVMLLIGAGNRDPLRFDAPDRFDAGRAERSTLSFGAGAHFCLGAALARMEGIVAFEQLLGRFPKLAPGGPAMRRPSFVLRGFESMPITLC